MTGLPVEQRFENHKKGVKAAWVVRVLIKNPKVIERHRYELIPLAPLKPLAMLIGEPPRP